MVFLVFYALITVGGRSFMNWGFLIIWSILFYMELSFGYKSITLKRNAWSIMIFYSALVILSQFLYIFSHIPIVKEIVFVRDFLSQLPKWVEDNPEIIGFHQDQTDGGTEGGSHQFIIPYLVFFLCSV